MMVQYAVAPEVLLPYLPQGVELDLFEGKCLVSLVGFLFDRVRVKGIAFPLHTRFPEVNLRFYVKRREPDGELRRGVVFVNEFVPRRTVAVALIAKTLYEEPYRALPMDYTLSRSDAQHELTYRWRAGGRWHAMHATVGAAPQPMAPGSLEEFITEHYWGYTKRSARPGSSRTSAYQVEHPRWETYPLRSWKLELDYATMYGPQWDFLTDTWADSVLVAEGSAVKVYTGFDLPSAVVA